jgi:valyl-tRNA synthetase
MKLEGARGDGTSSSAARLEDRWILSRLAAVREEVSGALEEHRYNDAATALYRFVWNDFCDWYLEIVKPRLDAADDASAPAARGTLARVLQDALAMLHPFTPYMTEVLSGALREKLGLPPAMLVTGPWPDGAGLVRDAVAESEMQTIQDLVRAVRSVRLLTGISERKPLAAHVSAPRAAERSVLEKHSATVKALAFLESCEVRETIARPANSAVAVAGSLEAFVPLTEDVDLEKLRESLSRRAEKVRTGIAGSDAKLANAAFVERADPEIVAEERARRAEMATELALLEKNVAGLGEGAGAR